MMKTVIRGYFLEVDAKYPKKLFSLHSDLPFLSERKKIEKCNKLIWLSYKKNYFIHMKALKQALNHRLIPKKCPGWFSLIKKAWLKPYIDMNTELRKEAKNDFEKDFFKLMSNAVFGKTMKNVRKHRNFKLVTRDKRRNQWA